MDNCRTKKQQGQAENTGTEGHYNLLYCHLLLIKSFQAKRQVVGEQSPFGWGSRMEHAAGTGTDVNCKEQASAAQGRTGKFSKDIGMQQMCLRRSLMNGVGKHKTPLPVHFWAGKRIWGSFFWRSRLGRQGQPADGPCIPSFINLYQSRYLVNIALTD